jgi:PhnB protein
MTIRSITPYLATREAAKAIEFYRAAFGAEEVGERYAEPDGHVGHAELRFGAATLYISDEHPDLGVLGPQSRGGETCSFVLEVDDTDAVFERAIKAGATTDRPPRDEPYGRSGWLFDPYGHRWCINGPVK